MKNKRFKKYAIKYLLEFIVIVLGISVSFWVNQIAVEKNENKERVKILTQQLAFWTQQDNQERFVYDLRDQVKWMLKNYS